MDIVGAHSGLTTHQTLQRRQALRIGLAAGLGGLVPLHLAAQPEWPQKAIRLVVPFAPGGTSDTLGRAIGKHLADAFRQAVIVENRPGAGGLLGSQFVAKAPPDGYTLVISGIASHVIAPFSAPQHFDPLKDFTHIAMLAGPPLALVVNAVVPVSHLKGLVDYVAYKPNGLSWGSPGQGTHGHLVGELFRAATGLHMVHIAYKGAGPALSDLVANQISAGVMTLSSANAHVTSGKLRLLAVTSPRRLPEFPDAPTMAELGYPELTSITWFGLAGPAGLPPALTDRVNIEVRRGLQTPTLRALLAAESMETADYDPAAFTRFVASEIARWTPPMRSLKMH
jgi:tripartite-type tricarboxylate transporter receptor subunit TctC